MNATDRALAAVGMTRRDMEREDFIRRSGRKAAKALRDRGYQMQRVPTNAGKSVSRWCPPGVVASPESFSFPAFYILVSSFARD